MCVCVINQGHVLTLFSLSDTQRKSDMALNTVRCVFGLSVVPSLTHTEDYFVGKVHASGPTHEEKTHTHGFSYCIAVCVFVHSHEIRLLS